MHCSQHRPQGHRFLNISVFPLAAVSTTGRIRSDVALGRFIPIRLLDSNTDRRTQVTAAIQLVTVRGTDGRGARHDLLQLRIKEQNGRAPRPEGDSHCCVVTLQTTDKLRVRRTQMYIKDIHAATCFGY